MALIEFKYITGNQIRFLAFILIIVIGFGTLKIFIRGKINKERVYIKGMVIDRGGYKGGVMLTVKLSNSQNPSEVSGDFYFRAIGVNTIIGQIYTPIAKTELHQM